MEILIITHYYKHKNAMASIRPIKFAKYFVQQGYKVTVLTSLQKDNWCKQELEPVASNNIREIYAPEHRGMYYLGKLYAYMKKRGDAKRNRIIQTNSDTNVSSAVKASSISKLYQLKSWLSWLFYYSCDRFENWCLYKGLVNAAKAEGLKNFDFVIATYPGAGIHEAGEWIKKTHRAKRFIADYRDPAYNPGGRTTAAEIRHDKRVQDDAVYVADAIVCVSNGMADTLVEQYEKGIIPPIYVVHNGFDPADNEIGVKSDIDKQYFNFVYTGALYNGRRTVDMLAKVLKELVDESVISKDRIKMHYAGSDYQELLFQLQPYGMDSIAVDHGYVTRQQSLALQRDADVVLLLNWNQDNYTGVIPGKIYEYMSAKTTICALIMGNQGGSETANMIRNDKLGCACEQAVPDDIQKLKQYMKNMFVEYAAGHHIILNVDTINKYQYENLSQKYLQVLNKHSV